MSRDLPAERVRKWYRLAQEQLDAAAEQVSLMEIRHHGAIADAGVSVAVSLAAQGAENLKTAAQSLQREAAQAQVEADANGDANATQAAEQVREIAMEAQEAADQLRLRASNLQTRVADALLGQEAANEIDRMTRASNAASSLWSAAKWLFGFVGFAAPLSLAYQQTNRGSLSTLTLVIIAVLTAIAAGVSAFLIGAIAASRMRVPQTAISSRRSAYLVMGLFFLICLAAIPVSIGFQAAAAFRAFYQATSERDAILGHRVELFVNSSEAVGGVTEYCKKHAADEDASDAFVTGCSVFSQTPTPTADRARALATALAR